jgi:type IV secretory pathway VirB10-like protein
MRIGRQCTRSAVFVALVLVVGCATPPPTRVEPAPTPAPVVAEVKPVPVPAVVEPPPPVVIIQQAPPAAPPPVNEEEQQAIALLSDLQRYAGESSDDLRRELAAANQAVNRARTDANRIRLAVLMTLPAAGPPDDARALALLDSVFGKSAGTSPVKQLAVVLYLQIAERTRGVAEEKRKTAAAQEKLDQLRAVERSLLIERSRNAGGAGGGGGGGTGR